MTKKNEPTKTALKITDNAKNNLFVGCKVNGGVEIDENAKDNKFIQTDITTSKLTEKRWYERPIGLLVLGTVASLLAWAIVFWWGPKP
jgi:hypothetical protein